MKMYSNNCQTKYWALYINILSGLKKISIKKRLSNILNVYTIEAENTAIAAISHPKFKNCFNLTVLL